MPKLALTLIALVAALRRPPALDLAAAAPHALVAADPGPDNDALGIGAMTAADVRRLRRLATSRTPPRARPRGADG